MPKYDHQKIEAKWQARWEKEKIFAVDDKAAADKKRYILDMFPYPSGAGLHVGHPEGYMATDIYCRYLRMKGYDVLHPMGWDGFGLPAENYAIKSGIHPAQSTGNNIKTFRRQIKALGFSYDWSREVNTASVDYYRWTQWLFLQFYKNGLAYKKEAPVNWCNDCQTVLANEQVVDGKCERCGHKVTQKNLEQWFLRITGADPVGKNGAYPERLLSNLDKLDWPEPIKTMQRNWIGKSEGAELEFPIVIARSESAVAPHLRGEGGQATKQSDSRDQRGDKVASADGHRLRHDMYIKVFTTRPDTLYGATYMVLSPEHPLIGELKSQIENWSEVEKYIKKAASKTQLERTDLAKEKTGVELAGVKALNPATGEEIPVWLADYVLMAYGTGAIMAVPAHDERDFEFAIKYDLPIKAVIKPRDISKSIVVGLTVKDGFEEALKNQGINFGAGMSRNQRKHIRVALADNQMNGYIKTVQDYLDDKSWVEIIGSKNILILKNRIIEDFFEQAEEVFTECQRLEPLVRGYKNIWEMLEHNLFYEDFVCYHGEGIMASSGEFDGMDNEEAKWKITKKVGGRRTVQYKLRDWLISRQRYWGAPIPIIYCRKCWETPNTLAARDLYDKHQTPKNNSQMFTEIDGEKYAMIPVPDEDLPVILPTDVDFRPHGESPLARSKSFHKVKCPKCGGPARRESDTMDTFVDSSWYFLRYTDPASERMFASKDKIKAWLPVDTYVGGAEHAVLHLMYARFFWMALRDLGHIPATLGDEPFLQLRNQGLILGPDGQKMSKSRGNVINPDEVVTNLGADTMRIYEMFMGPLADAKPWDTNGIIGVRRFLDRVWAMPKFQIPKSKNQTNSKFQNPKNAIERELHVLIKKVQEDIEVFSFNTAVAQFMIFVNTVYKVGEISRGALETFLRILSPFAPHLANELWEKLGHKELIEREKWPSYDEKLLASDNITYVVQINGKTRGTIVVPAGALEEAVVKSAQDDEKTGKYMAGKKIVKRIFVKGRLVNFVTT